MTKAGREWRGLSPFTSEKTPSFFVNDEKMAWFDLSSGRKGNIFDFVMATEGLTLPEAVERLAADAGLPLPPATPPSKSNESPSTEVRKSPSGSEGPFADVFAGALCVLIAIPICDASWQAIVTENAISRGAVGLVFGLPIGVLGLTFHWWKSRLQKIGEAAIYWWPIAIVLPFVYVAGPEIYRRAVEPTPSHGAIAKALTDPIARLKAQLKAKAEELQATKQSLGEKIQALEDMKKASEGFRKQIALFKTELEALRQSKSAPSPNPQIVAKTSTSVKTLDAITAIHMIDWLKQRSNGKNISGTLFISSSTHNQKLKDALLAVLTDGVPGLIFSPLPDRRIDWGAPNLVATKHGGLLVHGDSALSESIASLFEGCFLVGETTDSVDGLKTFTKQQNVIWIEIGDGVPWKAQTNSTMGDCYDKP